MQHKTDWKGKRSVCGWNKFPIRFHPTRSSAREHRRTRGVNIDDISVFHFDPHSNVSTYMHLQRRGRIGWARTPQQDIATRATGPCPVWCACGTAFDRAWDTVRVSMGVARGPSVRLYV